MWPPDFATLELRLAQIMFKWDAAGRRRLWLKLAKLIGNGVPILTALEFIRDRRISGFDVALAILGREWLVESVDHIKSRMSMVFSISIVIMGLLIGFMVSGMISMELQVANIVKAH